MCFGLWRAQVFGTDPLLDMAALAPCDSRWNRPCFAEMKTTEESITPADAQDIQRYRDELKPGEGLQFPSTRVCDLDCGDPSLRDRPPVVFVR